MAKYYGIATNIGEAAIANAFLANQKNEIKELAIGDGGGAYYEPTASMTALKNEVYRVNADTAIDTSSPNVVQISGILPSNVGGFTVRELGAIDKNGKLIGIANVPDAPKVILEEGADTEMDLGFGFAVSHSEVISLVIDPTIIIATKKDVKVAIERHVAEANPHPNSYYTKPESDEQLSKKVDGNWHFFDSLEELGLTVGIETIKSIVSAMPEKSTLYAVITSANNPSQYPNPEGFLTVVKHTNNRIDLQFNNSPVTLANWTGMANYTAESDYWSGWAENIIDNSPHLRVRNYYIDPVSGSDDNDGLSETTPFKSFMPVLKKYQVLAITGDFNVFLKSGTTIVVDTVYFNAGLSFSGKFTLTTYGGSTETTILSTSTSSVVSVAFRNMGELELINVKFERSQTFTSSVIVGVYAVFTGNIDNCAYKYTQTNTVNSDGIYIHRCGNVSMRMINFQNCKRNAVQSDYGTELFLENASGSNNARGLVATKSTIRKGANINLGATTAEVKEGGGEIL